MSKILNQSINGKLYICDSCNKIHFEYNNLNFTFDNEQFKSFSDYILSIDSEFWERKNKDSMNSRKVFLDIGHHKLNLAFSKSEIEELKSSAKTKANPFKIDNMILDFNYSNN